MLLVAVAVLFFASQMDAQFRARSKDNNETFTPCYTEVTEQGTYNVNLDVEIHEYFGNTQTTFDLIIEAIDQNGNMILISDEDEFLGISIMKGPIVATGIMTEVNIQGELHPAGEITQVCYVVTVVGSPPSESDLPFCSHICNSSGGNTGGDPVDGDNDVEMPGDKVGNLGLGTKIDKVTNMALELPGYSVFPNPSLVGQNITVSSNADKLNKFYVLDQFGRKHAEFEIGAEFKNVEIQLNEAGTYFIIEPGNPTIQLQFIVR